jgi:hypothetical protein
MSPGKVEESQRGSSVPKEHNLNTKEIACVKSQVDSLL